MVSWLPLVSIRYALVPRFSLYLTSLPTTTGCSSTGRALMSLATPVSSSLDLNCSLIPPLSASLSFSKVALNAPANASADANRTSYLLSVVPLWACHSEPPFWEYVRQMVLRGSSIEGATWPVPPSFTTALLQSARALLRSPVYVLALKRKNGESSYRQRSSNDLR